MRVVVQIVNMSGHTQSDGEDLQIFSISRRKLSTHRMRRLSQDTTQRRTGEQVVNKHVQKVVNSVEVKQSKIIKNTVQRKNLIVQQKTNQVSKQKGNSIQSQHICKISCCAKYDTKPRSSRQCRNRSLDPTTIRQAKINQINQFDKHVEILVEQYIDKEIDVPVMLQRNFPTAQTVHWEQWRSIRCSTLTQLTTFP